jgi:hypothetical protein
MFRMKDVNGKARYTQSRAFLLIGIRGPELVQVWSVGTQLVTSVTSVIGGYYLGGSRHESSF